MPDGTEENDWDAALVELIAEEASFASASQQFEDWANSPYGSFTKLDAAGTVAIAVAAYIAGYPNVQAFMDDLDENAIAWLIELMESYIIQGIFIGMGFVPPSDNEDSIYMSPAIVEHLKGEGYESHFDPPKDLNINDQEEED